MSDTGQRPDDRAFNRRERLADECEERARRRAQEIVTDEAELGALIVDLEETEQENMAMVLWRLLDGTNFASRAHQDLYELFKRIAYRRALAAERRKEGLE